MNINIKNIIILCAILFASTASAQSIQQSGTITPNHVPVWVTNGVIGDGGTAFDSPLSSLGITSNTPTGICVSSGRSNAAGRQQLCLGAPLNSAATISLQNYGTATPQGLNIVINGTVYPFTGGGGGSNVLLVGTSLVEFGVNRQILFNNNGILGEVTGGNSGVLVTGSSGDPVISPTLPNGINLSAATATSINKVAFTAPATSATLTIANGKTLTSSNTLTFAGTDASTLNIGAGGTLGSNAFTSTAYLPLTGGTISGTLAIGAGSAITSSGPGGALTAAAYAAYSGPYAPIASPTFTGTQTLTTALTTTLNGNTITTGTGTLTLGSATLNIGAGGTLGSNAFTSTSYLPLAGGTLAGQLITPRGSSGAPAIGIGTAVLGFYSDVSNNLFATNGTQVWTFGAGSGNFSLNSGAVAVSSNGSFAFTSSSQIFAPSDGKLTFYNLAASGFTQTNYGGVTSSFPALGTSGSSLEFRTADQSSGANAYFHWGGESRTAAQFDKTSSTALANVPGLSVSVTSGKTYYFTATLYTVSDSAGGVKAAIAGTATATTIIYEGQTTNSGTISGQTRVTSLGSAVGAVTSVTAGRIDISGTITANAGGTLTVQFAQNVSDGTPSSVLVGSTFNVMEFP